MIKSAVTSTGISTFTIPATKVPQLNAPMSFGTEMKLSKQRISHFRLVEKEVHYEVHKSSQTG